MSTKKNKLTRFSEESGEAAPDSAPSAAMLALFSASNIPGNLKLERRNMPTMYKPSDVPMGRAVIGIILKIVDSPVATVDGKLLWLRLENGTEITFPVTGVIRNALAPGVDAKDKDKLQKILEKEEGRLFIARRQPGKPSKFKKEMFMFEVFTAEPPKGFAPKKELTDSQPGG